MPSTRVAVVVDGLHDYQVPFIQGLESVLHARDLALLVVISHPQHDRRNRMIRGLIDGGGLHGMVIMAITDPLTKRTRVAEVVNFAKDLPCVTIGMRLPGIPALLVDNVEAMKAVMAHLVDDCGRAHPLLVAGPPDNDDSREREEAFRAVAAERGLDLPRTPVVHANFERERAYRRIIEVLGEGVDFDALVAANDEMALGVLDALHEHGLRIPQDVAVVGFDNTSGAYRADPSLSSVDAQLEEQGRVAARLLLDLMASRAVPDHVRVDASLVIRESSATIASDFMLPTLVGAGPARAAAAEPGISMSTLVDRMLDTLTPAGIPPGTDFVRRLRGLISEWLPKVQNATLSPERSEELGAELCELVVACPEPLWWRQLTATLQACAALTSPGAQVSDAVQAGILRTALRTDRALRTVREQRDREQLSASRHVLELNRALSGCRSLTALTRELAGYLPRLNIRRCFLVLFEREFEGVAGSAGGAARLAMSYRNGLCDNELDQTPLAIQELLPGSVADELDHGTLTVQPLFSGARGFGHMLHEQSPVDRHTGEALRREVSQVLDAIARARELMVRASELELLVVRRTAELELEIVGRRAAQESLREANSVLRRALLLDGLTGLQNRPSFDEHLIRAWHRYERSGDSLSLLMVDVDHFKLFNDTYGHLAGDTGLRRVALCLAAAVTRSEDVVARFGGEEFVVLLPGTGLVGARLVAQRLLGEVRGAAIPHSGGGSVGGCLSVSVGIATTAGVGVDSPERLIGAADEALYAAKRNGRDQAMEA